MPILRYLERAAKRHRVNVMDRLEGRHLDLLNFARRNVRLPIRSFELKTVGPYLGMSAERDLRDGFAAVGLFQRHRFVGATERASLRNQLLAYNCDDLEGLIRAAAFLRTRDLAATRALVLTYKTIELQSLLARKNKHPTAIERARDNER